MSAPHRKESHTNYEQLGWKLKREANYQEAITAFNKAIAYHQKTYFALHGKGECLLKLHEYEKALACFTEAIRIDRQHPWAYHGAGRAYHGLGRYDTALAHYEKSIHINKHGRVAWHWKGKTLIEMGEYEFAESALKEALRNAVDRRGDSGNMILRIEADLQRARDGKEKIYKPSAAPQIIIKGEVTALWYPEII